MMTYSTTNNWEGTFIIAEAGVNHNGKIHNAIALVDIAVECGADAIKFQTFLPGECTGKFAVKVKYMEDVYDDDTSRYEITQDLTLPLKDFKIISDYCKEKGIIFISTPDGQESLDFLVNDLSVAILKIASTEVTNLKFLEAVAKKGVATIYSTGLSTLAEVERGLKVMRKHNNDITVLHCVSDYPAPSNEINLKAMHTIRDAFGVEVGFSDHTEGDEACVAAVAMGAKVIEKHFTLDRNMPGPDHKASMEPPELKELIRKVRATEQMIGDGVKRRMPSELGNMTGIRRSVVAVGDLPENHVLTALNLTCKRPASGIHPYDIDKIIGMKTNRGLKDDEPIKWEDLH